MNYIKSTISGVSWSISQRWVIRGLTFVRLAILARILVPAQFGIFGVATIVLGLIEIITETWINVFLVQEQGDIDRYIDTAWIISIVRGLIICLAVFLLAPAVSYFFNSPQSLTVLRLASIVPLIRGLINPSIAKLQKYLLFKQEFIFRSLLFLAEALVAILVSLFTRDATGLVWGMLVSAALEVLLSFTLFSPRPKLTWSIPVVQQILSRGSWITAAGIFNFLYQHGDDIVVGRILGETGLGLYDPIYKISGLPVSEVSDVVAKVTFPTLVNLREDGAQLKNAFLKTGFITTGVTTIFGLGLFVFAPQIINLVLGPNWLPATSALRVLCLYGISRALISSIYPLFLATKKQEYVTWVTLCSLVILAVTIVPLVNSYGLFGAGLSATLGSVLAVPLAIYLVQKTLRQVVE